MNVYDKIPTDQNQVIKRKQTIEINEINIIDLTIEHAEKWIDVEVDKTTNIIKAAGDLYIPLCKPRPPAVPSYSEGLTKKKKKARQIVEDVVKEGMWFIAYKAQTGKIKASIN